MKKAFAMFLSAVVFLGAVGGVCQAQYSETIGGHKAAPANTANVVYVTDFELDTATVQAGEGAAKQIRDSRPRLREGGLLQQAHDARNDPGVKAQDLVDLMTNSLIEDLKRAGFDARKLNTGDPLPIKGWLVRGIFTQVGEGNRLQRASVGMGAGETQMQVNATIDKLAGTMLTPYYEVEAGADSGKKPGGAALSIVKKNPYAMAAKFVMSKRDLEKNVKQTAQNIADDVAGKIRR